MMDADEMFTTPGAGPTGPGPEEDAAATKARAERAETLLWLRGQWSQALPISGSPAEKYLVEHRGLVGISWPPSLRYAPKYQTRPDRVQHPCLLAAGLNIADELVVLHSIELSPL